MPESGEWLKIMSTSPHPRGELRVGRKYQQRNIDYLLYWVLQRNIFLTFYFYSGIMDMDLNVALTTKWGVRL